MTKNQRLWHWGLGPLAPPLNINALHCAAKTVLHGVVECPYVTVSPVFSRKRLRGKVQGIDGSPLPHPNPPLYLSAKHLRFTSRHFC